MYKSIQIQVQLNKFGTYFCHVGLHCRLLRIEWTATNMLWLHCCSMSWNRQAKDSLFLHPAEEPVGQIIGLYSLVSTGLSGMWVLLITAFLHFRHVPMWEIHLLKQLKYKTRPKYFGINIYIIVVFYTSLRLPRYHTHTVLTLPQKDKVSQLS